MSTPVRAPWPPTVDDAASWPVGAARDVRRVGLATGRVLLVGLLVLLMAASGLVVLGSETSATGTSGFLIGVSLAVLPVPVVIAAFRWVDRYEPEPRSVLAFAFFWGATVAALIAAVINTASAMAVARTSGAEVGLATTAVGVAPFVEEAAKGAAVLAVFLFRRREFDGVVDGIVYAGLVGAGFAFSENILYLGREYVEYGQQGLTELFILRCIMGPFAHPLFTAFTGIGLGLAVAVMRTAWSRVLVALGGFLLAALLHGIWNLSAATGHLIGAYVLFQIPLFLCFVALIVGLRYREGRLIRTYLSQYADAGWLSHQEVAMLSSVPARRQARVWANQQGGRAAVAAMRGFQDGASDLALLRARMVRGSAERDAAARERRLLESIVAHRRAFVGHLAY